MTKVNLALSFTKTETATNNIFIRKGGLGGWVADGVGREGGIRDRGGRRKRRRRGGRVGGEREKKEEGEEEK